jgi:hypothetical protein
MRPLISWSALTNAAVGIWGLGVEGTASLHRLQSMGMEPVLVDDHPAPLQAGAHGPGHGGNWPPVREGWPPCSPATW